MSKSESAAKKGGRSVMPFNDLLRLVEQGDPKASKALEQMADQLGIGLAMLVTGLAPDVVVVVGDVTRAWDRVGPVAMAAIKKHSFTHAQTRVLATDPEAHPRLRGAIALIAQKHFVAPQIV